MPVFFCNPLAVRALSDRQCHASKMVHGLAFRGTTPYAAPQRTWTRKCFRVALPAADPPDNQKATVHVHIDLARPAQDRNRAILT